jgi:hypothetical protein
MQFYAMKYIHYDVACRLLLEKVGCGGPAAGPDVPIPTTGRLHGPCHELVRAQSTFTCSLAAFVVGAPRVAQLHACALHLR